MAAGKLQIQVDADPEAKGSPRWAAELAEPDVRRWFDAMRIKSSVTASERLRVLLRYTDACHTTPAGILELAQKPKGTTKIANDLQDFATLMSGPHTPEDHGAEARNKDAIARCAKGHAPGYVASFIKAVRAFLRANDIPLVRAISIGDAGRVPTVENERVPTPAELRKVLLAASPRAKVVIAFTALAGLRPEVLGTMDLRDGLRLRDMPDVSAKDGMVRIRRTPAVVRVSRSLSKVKKAYITFLPREGCEFLRTYLSARLLRGEQLGPDSPIVRPHDGYDLRGRQEAARESPFIGRQGLSREIRQSFRAVRYKGRPYVLRSFFASALLSAQREGLITDLERELFLGRANAISLRYTLHKDLSDSDVEALRATFAKCEPFLSTKAVETPANADVAELEEARAKFEDATRRIEKRLAVLETTRGKSINELLEDPQAVRALRHVYDEFLAQEKATGPK